MKLLLLGLLGVVSSHVAAAEQEPSRPRTPAAYVEALAVANSFLLAWLNRDADTGVRLMSATLRQVPRGDDSWLRLYVQGLSNPHHAAFELANGKVTGNRAVFPVTLYEMATGDAAAFSYRSSLELVREGASWRVSKLPKSSEE